MALRECKCFKCSKLFTINSRVGVRKFCFECRIPKLKLNKEICLEYALLCSSRWEFQQKYPRHYKHAVKNKFLNIICSHMPKPQVTYTYDDCKEKALLCNTKIEFNKRFPSHSNSMYRNNWLEICNHMPKNCSSGSFTRTSFKENCDVKNKGLGLLYMLKCFSEEELFYKVGITSLGSVKNRYSGGSFLSNYKYEILWTIEYDPYIIWDMELSFKRRIKENSYTPKYWKTKSTECFICEADNILLNKPIIGSFQLK